jgi:sugar phosphate isomerase/epimerase
MDALTRRLFLAQMMAAGCATAPEPSRWKMAIGLNGFGSSEQYHDKSYDYDEILAFARDEGFAGIELWRNWREGYPDPADDAAIRAARQKIESYGLQVFSIQAGVSGANPISSAEAERESYRQKLKGQVDLAVKFGCDAMGLWAGGRPDDEISEDQLIERFAGVVKPVARYAVEQGIFLAIEGEPPLIINTVERYHKLFDAVAMDEFKVIFDPSHFDVLGGAEGRPEDLLLDLGVERVGYVQFCDGDSTIRPFPNGRGGTSRHLACGQGVYDIPKLCRILDEGGFEGWFQIDSWATEDAYVTSKTCKDAALDYLRGAGAEG